MNLRWLMAFRAVMELGTVTRAAATLYVTQPAVSRMLLSLEGELGFKLFLRHGGRLVPTREGEEYYKRTMHVLGGIDDALGAAADIASGRLAQLRIAAMSALAHGLLPAAISRMHADYPDMRFSIDIKGRRDVEQWIAQQQFDIGLAMLPVDHSGVATQQFQQAHAILVTPMGHRMAGRDVVRLDELRDVPMIALRKDSLLRHRIDSLFTEWGTTANIVVDAPSLLTACELVGRGLGVTIADPFTALALDRSTLAVCRLEPPIVINFGFLYPAARPRYKIAEHFAMLATEEAAAMVRQVPESVPQPERNNGSL